MAVRMYKEKKDGHVHRLGGGKCPIFREFIEACSPVHVWNLVLLRKVDSMWFDVYTDYMSGRQMRDVDVLCGKEIVDMLAAAERCVMTTIELGRRDAMFQADAEDMWHQACPQYVTLGKCAHGNFCRKIHVSLKS